MDLNLGWEIDMSISMLGIDIAKDAFQLHDADIPGKAVQKKRMSRREVAAHVANLPACASDPYAGGRARSVAVSGRSPSDFPDRTPEPGLNGFVTVELLLTVRFHFASLLGSDRELNPSIF